MPAAFVNPAALSAPSPSPSDDSDRGSPEPQSAPSRKRQRTDMSAEERKEARAHRNRIAAQNSRDRRKLQFSQLNNRVAELEEENRQLKEELSMYRSKQHPSPQVVPTFTDNTREQENEELRERVRSLEKSWESVVRMLAVQGKAGALPTPPISTSSDSGNSPLFGHASPTLSMLSATDGSIDEHTRHSARVATAGTPSPVSSAALQRVALKSRRTHRASSTASPSTSQSTTPSPKTSTTSTTQTTQPLRSSLASRTGSWTSSLPRRPRRASRLVPSQQRQRQAVMLLLSLAQRKTQLRLMQQRRRQPPRQ